MAQRPDFSDEIERHAARLEKDPASRVFAQLADAYRKEGLLEEAIQICRDGLVVHPTYVSARVVLGRALLDQGKLEEAEAEFSRVLEQVPDNLLALRLLGDIYAKRGLAREARGQYERALHLHPLDRETQERLAALPAEEAAEAATPPPGGDPTIGAPPYPLASPTLAALYESQGHAEAAEAIYSQVGRPPGDDGAPLAGGEASARVAADRSLLDTLLALREAARRIRASGSVDPTLGKT